MTWNKLYEKLIKSNHVLLIAPAILDLSTICSIGLMHYLLKSKNIKVDLAYAGKHSISKYADIFELSGINITNLLTKIDPIFYNIIIPNITDVNLNWFVNNGNLNVRIVSENKPIDFNSISFNKSGGLYDLVILLNIYRLEDVGEIFTNNPDRLRKFEIISLGNELKKDGYTIHNFLINQDQLSLNTYLIKNLLDSGLYLEENILKISIIGLAWELFYLNIDNIETIQLLSNLLNSYKFSYQSYIQKYFSYSDANTFKLKEILLKNIKLDNNRKIAYSVISTKDLVGINIDPLNFDFVFFLNLNLSPIYDFIFLIVEYNDYCDVYVRNNSGDRKIFIEIIEKLEGVSNTYLGYARLNKDSFNTLNTILNIWGSDVNFNSIEKFDFLKNETIVGFSDSTYDDNNNISNNIDIDVGQTNLDNNSIPNPFIKASDDMINAAFDPNANPLEKNSINQYQSPFKKANII